jgi:hypothetical protein
VFLEYSVRLEKTSELKECAPYLRSYVKDFGGDFYVTPYDSKISQMLWFYPDSMLKKMNFSRPSNSIFPSVVFGNEMNIDSLINIRILVDSILVTAPTSKKRVVFFEEFKAKIKMANEVLKKNTNFFYQLKTKKDEAIIFLFQPIQETPISANNLLRNIIIYLNIFLNVFFISLIIIVSFFSFSYKRIFKKHYYVYLPAVFLLLMYVIYFTIKEQRGLFCYFPAFLMVGLNEDVLINGKIKWLKGLKIITIICFVVFFGLYSIYILKR